MRTIERDIVGAFIFTSDNKVLLGNAGIYEAKLVIPGGGIEPGETELEAVVREVLEETGVNIKGQAVERLDNTFKGDAPKTLKDGETVRVVMKFIDFVVHLDKPAKDIPLISGDDFSSAKWYAASELAQANLGSTVRATLGKLKFL